MKMSEIDRRLEGLDYQSKLEEEKKIATENPGAYSKWLYREDQMVQHGPDPSPLVLYLTICIGVVFLVAAVFLVVY